MKNTKRDGEQVQIRSPLPQSYYVNYPMAYQYHGNNQILGATPLENGGFIPKTNNFMSFGQKITNERINLQQSEYDLQNKNRNIPQNLNMNNINITPTESFNKPVNLNENNDFFLNSQPMRLENIINANYQGFSPSKKINNEHSINYDQFGQRTPKKN